MTLNFNRCYEEIYKDQVIAMFCYSMLPPSMPWYTATVDDYGVGNGVGTGRFANGTEALEAAKEYADSIAELMAKRQDEIITLTLNFTQVKQLIRACQIISYNYGLSRNQQLQERRIQFYYIQRRLEELLGIQSEFKQELTLGHEVGLPETYKGQEIIIFRSKIYQNSQLVKAYYTVRVDNYDFPQHFDTQSEAFQAAKAYCDRMADIFTKNQDKIFTLTLTYRGAIRLTQACRNAASRLRIYGLLEYLESTISTCNNSNSFPQTQSHWLHKLSAFILGKENTSDCQK